MINRKPVDDVAVDSDRTGNDVLQTSHANAAVDNKGASYSGIGAVYNGPVTIQSAAASSSRTYTVPNGHDPTWERFARFIMERFSETSVIVSGVASVVAGGGGIALTATGHMPVDFVTIAAVGSFVLIAAGVALLGARRHKHDTLCEACGRHFAMRPVGLATVRETDVRGGVQVETTQVYQCAHCKAKETYEASEFEADEPEEDN